MKTNEQGVPSMPGRTLSRLCTDLRWGALFGAILGVGEIHAAYVTSGRMALDAVVGVIAYDCAGGLLGAAFFGFTRAILRRCRRIVIPDDAPHLFSLSGFLAGAMFFVSSVVFAIYQAWTGVRDNPAHFAGALALCATASVALWWGYCRLQRLERPRHSLLAAFVAASAVPFYSQFLHQWMFAGSQGPTSFALYLVSAAGCSWLVLYALLRIRTIAAWSVVVVTGFLSVAVRPLLPVGELSSVRDAGKSETVDSAAARQHLPNVVMVVLDTLRADHMDLYGYARPTTPRLRELAAEGTMWLNANSTSSWTLPSHASLFTGLPPSQHGADASPAAIRKPGNPGFRPLPPDHPVLAELLRTAGYRTAGIAANCGFLRPRFGLDRGFEYWDSRATFNGAASAEGYLPFVLRSAPIVDYTPLRWLYEPLIFFDVSPKKARRAEEINREAFAWLRDHGGPDAPPFFLFLNYMDVHHPYLAPGEFADRFPGRSRWLPRRVWGVARAGLPRKEMEAHFASQYDSELAYLDSEIGRLADYMRDHGLWNNTILIITGDHGEAFGEHDHFMHGNALYQEEIRVPLIIVDPTATQHEKRIEQPVDLRAVMPWLMRRLQLSVPPALSDLDLSAPSSFAVAEQFGAMAHAGASLHQKRMDQVAFRRGSLKAIHFSDGVVELYDLSQDPQELQDLVPSRPELAQTFRSEIDEWIAAHPAIVRDESGDADKQDQALRELGYIE